jgi:phosphate acyltransferase
MSRPDIALDVMGGDNAPKIPIQAAVQAVEQLDVRLTLIGDQSRIHALLPDHSRNAIEVIDAPEHVGMEDEAVSAVRRKRRASIPVGLELLREQKVDAFVSAGNTGAVVASSVVSLGRLPGVSRPGIAIPFPTSSGPPMLLIDAGAIVDPKPEYLWQHARLASVYAGRSMGITSPTVGLINNGEEPGKGNSLTRSAFQLIDADPALNFVGNVEPKIVSSRPCDVLVTDGYTGNIVLKTGEGIVTLMQDTLRAEFRSRWYTALLASLLKSAFRRAGRTLDYREIGGAPLLGVNGLVVIAHGSSDETALFNAIKTGIDGANQRMLSALTEAVVDSTDSNEAP